jgi:hypothetical protein
MQANDLHTGAKQNERKSRRLRARAREVRRRTQEERLRGLDIPPAAIILFRLIAICVRD